MRERDENAYIRFFALWFAAGMTLGVLLLLTASHTGMKEGNSVRLFQAEAFFGRKISATRIRKILRRTIQLFVLYNI